VTLLVLLSEDVKQKPDLRRRKQQTIYSD